MDQGNRKRRARPLLVAAVGVAAISYVQGAVAASAESPAESSVQQHPVGNLRPPPPPPPPDGGTQKP